MTENRTVLVTGSAGFIGFHVCRRLLADGWRVIGFDALTDHYDVSLKRRRHDLLKEYKGFTPVIERLENPDVLLELMRNSRPHVVFHLAAQAGVRHSIDQPRSYLQSNVVGTFELLEAARAFPPQHMLMASTSSAYGANTKMPYKETDKADHPMSFYAATKKATEAMAHSYAHLYALPITMFRFFTVYGPWGRPDMALFKFTDAILRGLPIDVYNYGDMQRDFTYVDDLVEGLVRLIGYPPVQSDDMVAADDSLSPVAPFRIINLGNSEPVQLTEFIEAIELATQRTAIRNPMPMQAGDVPATWADTSLVERLTGFRPRTTVQQGVPLFVDWYCSYYGISRPATLDNLRS